MTNLKESIKEAKNNPELWNVKIKTKSPLIIKKSLKELNSDHYWNKVEIINPWYPDLVESFNSRGFFYYLDAGNGGDVIRIGNSGEKKFKHWFETYTGKNPYELYGNCDEEKNFWGFSRLPRDKAKLELANLFKNASKVFGRNGNDKSFLNQDAFEFMQIATGHEPLSISYQVGEEFFLKDFENDVDKIGDDVVIEKGTVAENDKLGKVNLNNFSSSRMHGGSGGRPFNDLDVIRNTIGSNVNIDAIWISKIMIRAGDAVDGIQFTYIVKNGENLREINGTRCGGTGGVKHIVELKKGEYLTNIEVQYGENNYYIGGLKLDTYNTQTGKKETYIYGRTGDKKSQLSVKNEAYATCLFGRSGGCVDAIGIKRSSQNPQQLLYIEQDKVVEFTNAQQWLNSQGKYNTKEKRKQIVELDLSNKNLEGELDLSDFVNLEKLNCSNNRLTSLNLSCQGKLKELNIRRNNFTSLEFIQPLIGLECLDFWNNNITSGLEHLPLSLKEIECEGEIKKELSLYGNNLFVWQENHPELMEEVGKKSIVNVYENASLETFTTAPEYLEEEMNKVQETITNYNLSNLVYDKFALQDYHPLSWEIQNKSLTPQQLPLRLYNLRDKKVETTNEREDINEYLALSYVWGADWEKDSKTYGQAYETKLTKLGRKALNKVVLVFELINQGRNKVNYIWIDNFCINQTDKQEQGEEVKKQKQYYNNATATLIAIDAEIGKMDKKNKFEFAKHALKKIVASPWFKRSWTFQEGLLSKQTIFMFDDYLVDGRVLTQFWGGMQKDDYRIELRQSPTIYITPLGWSYGAQWNQAVNLGLMQALDSVKYRQQTVPIDGIYSILGLLPYGKDVEVSYSKSPKQALLDIMKVAKLKGHPYEPLSWTGERQRSELWWWIPDIKNGSVNIWGFQKIEANSESLEITARGIKLIGEKDDWDRYTRIIPNSELIKSDKKFNIYIPYSYLPIKVEKSDNDTKKKNSISIDMVSGQVEEREQITAKYQTQIEVNPYKK